MPNQNHIPIEHAGALLEIDLSAIRHNYSLLRGRLGGAECAAVIKADAYGLGAARVGPALWSAGARCFFVAHLDEGIGLRATLPQGRIFILHGPPTGTEAVFKEHNLLPVLCTGEQVTAWSAFAAKTGYGAAALQVDTGMNRLGLSAGEVAHLHANPDILKTIDLKYIISHLSCADIAEHPLNAQQLGKFMALRKMLPAAPASLANSAGIFLGPDFHFDLARPGVALAGVNPTPGADNPMRPVVRLRGRILQCRQIDSPDWVGYGAGYQASGPRRVATIPVGYADGYVRSLGNQAFGSINNQRVPIIGRVSMDLITLDVSDVPPEKCRPGDFVDLIGGQVDIDELAEQAGTIAYEILTALGNRYARSYVGGLDDHAKSD